MARAKVYSESTAQEIDGEVKRIIDAAYKIAKDIITTNLDKLELIAKSLLEYETLDGQQVEEIVRTGIGLVVLDLSAIPPALRVVPNTEDISSVTVSAGGHAVYFTRNNERWIYQLVLANSAYRTAYGFPPGEIARDVQVAGRRLVAVVGGKVSYQDDPVLGPLQRDHGGRLWVVDLETGAANVLVVEGRFFRRPALSPDGTRLVAEAYETTITSRPESLGGGADTVVGNVADLWLFDLP